MEQYYEKLIKYYDADGKLKSYPSKRPMRMIALIKIASKFENKEYNEKEVNEVIKSSITFNDVELIRRELIDYKFLSRLRDGSKYWLNDDYLERYQEYNMK